MVNPNETLVWNKSLEIEIHNGENIRCIPRVLASVNERFIFRHFCFIEGIFLRPTCSNPFHRLETFKRKKKKKKNEKCLKSAGNFQNMIPEIFLPRSGRI